MKTETVIEVPGTNDRVFNLIAPQSKFLLSEARYPAYVASWGTGKTLAGICRAMRLSELYQNNLGVVFRKEYTDLRDSTLKDFENYTGLTVGSDRGVKLQNGSEILFRHLEELNNIQNINLGWFWIEQAEELDTDTQFFTLFGRLRRAGTKQSGFITANTRGHNWVYRLWKKGELEDSYLSEATTADNAKNLPAEYIDSLSKLKDRKPELYQRFVLNSWDELDEAFVVIPARHVRACAGLELHDMVTKRVTVADIAGESEASDETVIYDFQGYSVKNQEIYTHRDLMDTVGRIMAHARMNKSNMICLDRIGIGEGVYARLCEIYTGDTDMDIYGFDGRVRPPEGSGAITYGNYKTYAWFNAAAKLSERTASVPNDEILLSQLMGVTYSYRQGKLTVDPKDKLELRLGSSPDRADCYVMGLDALSRAKPILRIDKYNHKPKPNYSFAGHPDAV